MKVRIMYKRLRQKDWRPRMPAREVAKRARYGLCGSKISSRGGVTKVEAEIGGLTFSTYVVCSAEENFWKKEGRSRAVDKLVTELRELGLWGTAQTIADLYESDLLWLVYKVDREAQETFHRQLRKTERDAENKADGLTRQKVTARWSRG